MVSSGGAMTRTFLRENKNFLEKLNDKSMISILKKITGIYFFQKK